RPEALIEGLVLCREIGEQLVRGKTRPILFFKLAALGDEVLRTHHVDPRQRAAGEWRKAEAEDRADVGLAHVGEHLLLEAARGLERLDAEQAQLELPDVDLLGIERLRLEVGEPGPQLLRSVRRIIVETLAV